MPYRSLSLLSTERSLSIRVSEELTEMQNVMPDHPFVSAVLWHIPAMSGSRFTVANWFTADDLKESESFTGKRRRDEWLAVRIALKRVIVRDGIAESPLHVHVRKNEKGCPHVVVYNPTNGRYARLSCSLSHKGSLVFAAYAKQPGIRVGIDMEKRSWRLPYLRKRFISERDRMIDKDDHVGDCTVLWTFKEAGTKLLGTGMAYGLANMQCWETSVGLCELRDAGGVHYSGRYTWFGKYALAVVTEQVIGADLDKTTPVHPERSWYERMARARRLRELRKNRRISAHLERVKSRPEL